jgi:tetratricopeptide (TPR) repeat protein
MRSALAILLLVLTGCRPAGTLEDARRLLREGDLAAACRAAQGAFARGGRAQALAALRSWIDCETRRGEERRVARALAARPEEDPVRLYGEALLAFARDAGALPDALARLARAAERWPDEAELPYRAAVLLLADEDARRALPLLERACRLADTAACAVARAHALCDLGRVAEAYAEVRRVPRLSPRPEDLAQGRALIRRLGRRAEEVPEAARARLDRVRELLEVRERPGEALRLCEELLVDFPRLALLHTLAGLSQLRLGNLAEAVVELRRGAELNPGDARNPLFLAVIHETGGRIEESVASYRRALELDPFLGQAALRLAELQTKLGQLDEARRLYAHARAVQPSLAATVAKRLAGLRAARR